VNMLLDEIEARLEALKKITARIKANTELICQERERMEKEIAAMSLTLQRLDYQTSAHVTNLHAQRESQAGSCPTMQKLLTILKDAGAS
jgi:hypothetical protein